MRKEELQLVSTTELTEELASRFDGLIVQGIQRNPKGDNNSNYFDHSKGDYATRLGLIEILKDMLMKDADKATEN